MDQDDVLGHDTYLDGGLVSDTGIASKRVADSQSEDMDTTAKPSGAESYSGRPIESQDARRSRGNPEPTWGEGENEAAQHRRLYPKVQPYAIPAPQRVDNGWYQREDLMDPGEVASPACRVGRPNVDGSIGGDQGNAIRVGNTSITIESCTDELPILVPRRTRKVNTLISLRRNALSVPCIKIRPSRVMVIGKSSWPEATTFPLPKTAR